MVARSAKERGLFIIPCVIRSVGDSPVSVDWFLPDRPGFTIIFDRGLPRDLKNYSWRR